MTKNFVHYKSEMLIILLGLLVLISGWLLFSYSKVPSEVKIALSQVLSHTKYCLGVQPKTIVAPSPASDSVPYPTPEPFYHQNTTFGTTTVDIYYPSDGSPAEISVADSTLTPNQRAAFEAVDQLAISSNTREVLPVITDESVTFFTINDLGRANDASATKEIKLTSAAVNAKYPEAKTKTLTIVGFEPPFNGIYTGMKFIGYVPNKKAALVRSAGGDGCGGWGVFWLISESGTREVVQRFDSGCITDSSYRYGGLYNNKLLFAKVEVLKRGTASVPMDENDTNETAENVISLFTIDPLTLVREIIPFAPHKEMYDLSYREDYLVTRDNSIALEGKNGVIEYFPDLQTFGGKIEYKH